MRNQIKVNKYANRLRDALNTVADCGLDRFIRHLANNYATCTHEWHYVNVEETMRSADENKIVRIEREEITTQGGLS